MKKQISFRDWERLSAYLDGELSAREKVRLETRLAQDAALRSALGELRRLKTALHSLPMVRPRRSFVLTRQMVGAPRPSANRWYPLVSWMAAVASLLFVVLLWRDVVAPRMLMPSSQAVPEAAMEELPLPSEKAAEAPAVGAQPQMTAPAPLQSMGEEEGDVTEGFVPAEPTPPKEVRAPQPMVLPPMLPLWATGFLAFILVALAVWLRKMRSGS